MKNEFDLQLEMAKSRYRNATHAIFHVPLITDAPIYHFGEEREDLLDKLVLELFNSGALYHDEVNKRKIAALDQYSKEAVKLRENTEHYYIAAEYVAGVKSQENSKIIASNFFDKLISELKRDNQLSSKELRDIEMADKYIRKYFDLNPLKNSV